MPALVRYRKPKISNARQPRCEEINFGSHNTTGTKSGGPQCVGLPITTSISFTPRVSAVTFDVKTSAPEAKESTSIANRDLFIPGSYTVEK